MQILQTIWTALATENEPLVNITGIPFCFIEAYLLMLLFMTLFNLNATKQTKIIFICSFSILGCISRFLISDPYGTYLNIIFGTLLIFYLFKLSLLNSLISLGLPIAIETLISFLLLKLFINLFNITSNDATNIPIFRIIFSSIEYVFVYIFYRIFKILNFHLV